MKSVKIEYFGHSCFRLSCGGQRIVLDPYADGSVAGLKNLRLDRVQGVMMFFRFLLSPALCALLCMVFGVSGLGRSVFMVESAMPVVTQTVVASAEYGADEQLAAQGAALSTLACFVVIPVLMLLL